MDPSGHGSDRTADHEHDVQSSDLQELAGVNFFVMVVTYVGFTRVIFNSWDVAIFCPLFTFFVTEHDDSALKKYRLRGRNIIRGGRNPVESNEEGQCWGCCAGSSEGSSGGV